MKRLLAILGFSCMHLFVHGNPMHVTCEDDISIIQDYYTISFGDAVEAGITTELSLAVSWSVAPQTGVSKASGTGKTTGNLVFSQPGKYQILFRIPAHGLHPAKTEIVTVEVTGAKMTFDLKNIVFSRPLSTGSASGIVMTVPVTVTTFDGKPYNYSAREIQTTGIADVSARLNNGTALLANGFNQLSFELSGSVPTKGNIQFRFYHSTGEAQFFNYSITD